MELNDSTRSALRIDLNEVPSSSDALSPDAFSVVRTYHDEVDLPSGAPAELPDDSFGSPCASCSRTEVEGRVVVCDGCERGFHLGCVGVPGEREVEKLDEWRCGECVSKGVQSSRWQLGSKRKRSGGVLLLDMNALPPTPSDGEGEGSEDSPGSRKRTPGDNCFGGNPFGVPMTYSNLLHVGNGFCFHGASDVVTQMINLGVDDTLHHNQRLDRSFEGPELQTVSEGQKSKNTAIMISTLQDLAESHLYALKEYVVGKQGALEDDWRIEFNQFKTNTEPHVLYCAPDGRKFASMTEVACYLGLISDNNLKECETSSHEPNLSTSGLQLPKRRKSTVFSRIRDGAECKENIVRSFHGEKSSDINNMSYVAKSGKSDGMSARLEESIGSDSQQVNDGFPVQYEDFFVLSLGKIDRRLSYHNMNKICPIGFRSCWHDKITGSIFVCTVSNGGEFGPIFKIHRFSCSAFPVPNASTVLCRKNVGQSAHQNEETNGGDMISMTKHYDDDFSVLTLLSELPPPTEVDILSCIDDSCFGSSNVWTSDNLQLKDSSVWERIQNILANNSVMRDDIGELSVEESSSSIAWRNVSEKLIETCRNIHMKKGTLALFCKHFTDEIHSSCWDILYENNKEKLASLAKFCSSSEYVNILSLIESDRAIERLFEELSNWLNQDRFGLDLEFVQEIVEQLPGVEGCSNYVFINERSSSSPYVTVGNGLLEVRTNGRFQAMEESLLKFFGASKNQIVQDAMTDDCYLPPGKPIGLKLPPWLVGDVIQVWEMLGRFQEVLDLKDTLSFEELEDELVNPWLDGITFSKKFVKDFQESRGVFSHKNDGVSDHVLSPSSGSVPAISTENSHAFIELETGAMKETAEARASSVAYGGCTGFVLTKVHNSLLNALISELQSKVASVVDPNTSSGEPKSKRGRRKDTDGLIAGKKTMQNILPFNEFTWPELARRYILAILAMDGDPESAEVIIRESGKVFRCLQGDGGVLCGSLSGVAGIEADALLLAEATKKIFGSLKSENDTLTMDDICPDGKSSCERVAENEGVLPEWAQVLEPVRKLPTNVGARLRKCVYEALEKSPPEWAKEILEHSISKEVYKGNASGPTKRAVLSVLSRVCNEGLQQKPSTERKKKKFVCISDLIMKRCRIVLRRAAAADDAKVFCNLLGRKLIHSGDNDVEGILGSPAMISRSLDFRTIDLRLAAGAYGGSHEAFLEDIRELWINVRVAYEDEPDMVHLAETLSNNFESLYEKEVVTLLHKLEEYGKSDCLTVEAKKEINHLLVSVNEIPKAPWEEGVCKVCGIDRDDDSVLLCDTCDAEYHTYCLIPPLARIPEGNWYCPSCIAGKNIVQDASKVGPNIFHSQKKNQLEGRRTYLDRLAHLATVLEEREYWELSVDERIHLLKFLCDELLNSALIRQHLEQCAEATTDLQQKLRSLSAEWKSLKCKGVMTAKAAKVDRRSLKSVGDGCKDDGTSAEVTNIDKCNGQFQTSDDRNVNSFSDSLQLLGDGQRWVGHDNQIVASFEGDRSFRQKELRSSSLPLQDINYCGGESIFQGGMENDSGKDMSTLSPCDDQPIQGLCTSLDHRGTHGDDAVAMMEMSKPTSDYTKFNLRNEAALLQNSILGIDMQLLKLSIRREFLGNDSSGRLYWVLVTLGSQPCLIVNENAELKYTKRMRSHTFLGKHCSLRKSFAPFHMDGLRTPGNSSASCPLEPDNSNLICSYWVSYQTDSEIKKLVHYLKDNDPRESELKESILHFQKLLCQDSQCKTLNHDEHLLLSRSRENVNPSDPYGLSTKATSLLESKYGPCIILEVTDLKKQGKRAKSANDKMCRCECLEPLWPSRHHCLSCHKSFSSDVELDGHNDGKCCSVVLAFEKSKESSDALKGKSMTKTVWAEDVDEISSIYMPKNGCSELSTRLIRYQHGGTLSPFDFHDICSKFVVENSNKELVKEIGLIGSNGIPSLVPSFYPYLSDPALSLVPQDGRFNDEEQPMLQGKEIREARSGKLLDFSPSECHVNESNEALQGGEQPAFQCLEQRDKKSLLFVSNAGKFCVVPVSSLRPLVGKVSHILRQLKINLLDMEAVLPHEALRPSKAHIERRWAWRTFLKSAQTIYEMVQAIIVFEDMIRTEYLRNVRWYWSSLSAAAKISTLSSLALYIYSLDLAIDYEKIPDFFPLDPISKLDKKQPTSDPTEKGKVGRKANKKRKEPED